MVPTKRSKKRRTAGDRGATLVEAAFVMPVFVLLIFGIFEFSGYIMAKSGTNAAVKAGARMAVVQGSNAMADRAILERIATEGVGIQQDKILRVMIWKADSVEDPVPTSCGASNDCNLYTNPQTDFTGAFARAKLPLSKNLDENSTHEYGPDTADYWFGCTDADTAHKLDCDWKPASRRILEPSPVIAGTCESTPSATKCQPTDYIGIYVETQHDFYTGFFGDQVVVDAHTVAKIEPQGYDK